MKKQSGFTLVELSVVAVIIGILIAAAIPRLDSFMVRSKQAEARSNLRGLFMAVSTHHARTIIYLDYSTCINPASAAFNTDLAPFNFVIQENSPKYDYCFMSAPGQSVFLNDRPAKWAASAKSKFGTTQFKDVWRINARQNLCPYWDAAEKKSRIGCPQYVRDGFSPPTAGFSLILTDMDMPPVPAVLYPTVTPNPTPLPYPTP